MHEAFAVRQVFPLRIDCGMDEKNARSRLPSVHGDAFSPGKNGNKNSTIAWLLSFRPPKRDRRMSVVAGETRQKTASLRNRPAGLEEAVTAG
jgi:hypothetical protein